MKALRAEKVNQIAREAFATHNEEEGDKPGDHGQQKEINVDLAVTSDAGDFTSDSNECDVSDHEPCGEDQAMFSCNLCNYELKS